MQIRTRFSMSVDGYVTTPDGWPPLVRDPAFVSDRSHGFPEFQQSCEAVLMGRVTFEPTLTNDRWPWPNLDVFVLGSNVAPRGRAGTDCHRQQPGAAAGEATRRQPRRRCAPGRWIPDDRDVPDSRRARQARPSRGSVVPGRRNAAHSVTQQRHSAGPREVHPLPEGAVEIIYSCS